MKTYPTLILLCVVVVYRGCGAVEKIRTTSSDLPDDDTPFPDFPTTPSTTSTTDFFSTNPTTISTTTTTDFFPTSPTTTTTTPSTTTTDSTATSTTVPTTTTTPTTTTVPSTTPTTPTTTGAPTTTTPAPNHPNPSTWMVVEEGTNVTCLVIKLSATFIVPYTTRSGKVVNSTLSLSPNATANGTCGVGTTEQAISLKWFAETEFFNQNMMTVFFKKNTTSVNEVSYFISDISLDVYPDSKTFPDSLNDSYIRSGMGVNESLFSVRVNSSYRCNAQEQLKLDIDGQLENSFVSLSNFQVEAFRTQTNDKFNSAVDCAADRIITSDIVPIAVGCALAALVVIVLVAYLIGRRRARQRGYQSV